jgi:hypothetical protein
VTLVRAAVVAAVLALWTAAVARELSGAAASLEPTGVEWPARLSDTGLYARATTSAATREIDPRNRAFSPQYPLWTDGATKRRWIYLPPGGSIDGTDETAWTFPVGTRFWKEFSFFGRPVETRMSWLVAPGRWAFASYAWRSDGRDADLAPSGGVPAVVEIAPGKAHSIPSREDCLACHGSKTPAPLGFTLLQLSKDRDPGAVHGERFEAGMATLDTLVAEGVLRLSSRDRLERPPRIATASTETRAVLGYLYGNCGSCHNGNGEIAVPGPVVRQADLLTDGDRVARQFLGQPTVWQVPGATPAGSVLVDPQAPELSALLVRMKSRRPASQMPPLGTVVRDDEAIAAVRSWIAHVRE